MMLKFWAVFQEIRCKFVKEKKKKELMGVSVIQHLCFYMKVLIVTLVLDIDVEKFMNFGLYNVKLHGLEFDISMS